MPARTRSQTRAPPPAPPHSPPPQQARGPTRTEQPVLSIEAAQQSPQLPALTEDANVATLAWNVGEPSSSSEASSAEERNIDTGRSIKQQKTSRFLGVTLSGSNADVRWWTAQIHKHRHKIRIGYSYATEEAAARAYDRASIAINGHSSRTVTNFPLDRYPKETEHQRDGADLDAFLESLHGDVNPEGVPEVPHIDGWVPPALTARRRQIKLCASRSLEVRKKRRLLHSGPAAGTTLHLSGAEGEVAGTDMPSSPHTHPQPQGLQVGSHRDVQVMEKALLDAQHGAARLASEAAGPVHLHTQPPPQQPLRLARTCYPALLSRVQLDLAASRMSTFDAPEDSDHEQPESSDPDGPTGDAGPGERQGQQPGCRVCRSARHTTRRCPVVWLTGRSDASSEQIQAPAQRDGQEGRSEECPWLAHVPDSVKDLMDAMQQYATDAVQRGAYDGSARAVKHSFSPEALLAATLLVDEAMHAAAEPRVHG